MTPKSITVREYIARGAPEGQTLWLATAWGPQEVTGITSGDWILTGRGSYLDRRSFCTSFTTPLYFDWREADAAVATTC